MSRERMSHSQLFDIEVCGEAYRRRYLEHDRTQGTLLMYPGSAVGALASRIHTAQLDAKAQVAPTPEALIGTLPTAGEAAETAVTAFEARIEEEGVTITEEDRDVAGSELHLSPDGASVVVHGELEISKATLEGEKQWIFSGGDACNDRLMLLAIGRVLLGCLLYLLNVSLPLLNIHHCTQRTL
jgi:hypothetical protein